MKNFCGCCRGSCVQAAEQLGVHAGHAGRRFQQPFAIRVFADRRQNLAHRPLDPRQIDVRRRDFQRRAVAARAARSLGEAGDFRTGGCWHPCILDSPWEDGQGRELTIAAATACISASNGGH